jgi:branched-chain amino acid aminotransferase
VIHRTDKLKEKPPKDFAYTFGGITTDYMLECNFDMANGGWQPPLIKSNEPFMLDPANATLQYSIECFEGMKAYITVDNKVTLFRPDMNFKRMQISHRQLGMPGFDIHEMTECLKELVKIEKDWIP